jgi:hypothetical protein
MLVLSGCRQSDPPSRLRFCESFSEKNEAIGEDSVFSPGTVSVIVESGWPVDADQLKVRIFRMTGQGYDPYGDEAGVAITRFDTVIRLERILSFADTGQFVVRVATPDNKFIVNGRVRIEPLN